MLQNKVSIVGVAPYGISILLPKARRVIKRADILIGGRRLLDQFSFAQGEKIVIDHNLKEVVELIHRSMGQKSIAVLASGDPNLYGIGGYLIKQFGKEAIEIFPNISSMQVAFALIKETWEDAYFLSVHGRNPDSVAEFVSMHQKVGIFTDETNTPARIAGILLEHGLSGYTAFVCQELGSSRQKVFCTGIEDLIRTKCSPLNVLILLKKPGGSPVNGLCLQRLGIPDEEFTQRKPKEGLITKQEIRMVSLGKMGLNDSSQVWDIGAGSGAVSIEASLIARWGRVIAIEKNAEDVEIIRENIRKFDRPNIAVLNRRAPEGLETLPDPSAVFIGGSDGQMQEILKIVCSRLDKGGRIVANAATLENLQAVQQGLEENGFRWEITQLNVSRSKAIGRLTRLEPLNPVFVILGMREENQCQIL